MILEIQCLMLLLLGAGASQRKPQERSTCTELFTGCLIAFGMLAGYFKYVSKQNKHSAHAIIHLSFKAPVALSSRRDEQLGSWLLRCLTTSCSCPCGSHPWGCGYSFLEVFFHKHLIYVTIQYMQIKQVKEHQGSQGRKVMASAKLTL